ncbi:MAG: UDP-N-acetylmuramate--L-alanine ligase [Prevotellaceae bacterium]|jgi:UDP-N-acetylmuramate--alanine ligase|nr:UDP-N-acetylmuramate--L-alanine ligase [Prevotellaceae bacterium]
MTTYNTYYFLGIGGIGMSALARYYKAKGFPVAGYDRTRTQLTQEMESEGISIFYEDEIALIPAEYRNPTNCLVVLTPAIPPDSKQWTWFRENGFTIMKRAQVLGEITRHARALCVAGTHGKTTTSTLTAYLLYSSHIGCNAFLGGVSKNFDKNILINNNTDLVVIEADEFDRSFHQLSPYMAVITAADPDHLDIYGSAEVFRESFEHFTSLIQKGGCLMMRKDAPVTPRLQEGVKLYTYSGNDGGDFHAENIRIGGGEIIFDFVTPSKTVKDMQLGVPVLINVENSVAAMAIAYLNCVTEEELRKGLASFRGIRRRFDFHVKNDRIAYLDDYAHHPKELRASISSVKALFPDKKICGIFQPHLYTRTRDFFRQFAEELSKLDEVILLDIYPARERPIEGISSKIIFDEITTQKTLCTKEELLAELPKHQFDVLVTMGAGDIEQLIPAITNYVQNNL